jgi:hypothetical protein
LDITIIVDYRFIASRDVHFIKTHTAFLQNHSQYVVFKGLALAEEKEFTQGTPGEIFMNSSAF